MLKDSFLKGRQRMVTLVSLLLLAVAAFAVPAKPGLTRTLTLSDGSTVNATLVGDEYLHYWLGEDGKAYQAVTQQRRGAKGGSENGDAVYQTFDVEAAQKSADERRSGANQRRSRRLAPRKAGIGEVGNISGQKKGIIILVNFADKAFTATQTDFYNLANTVNYNSGNYKGSMYDYFYAQSDGKFRLTFDVVGPYTVSQNCAYYGANDSNGDDIRPAEMVIEAVKLADNDVNFANYDWDNDGYVDQVYVVYAGKGEADGGADDTIWPHEYDLYSASHFGDGTGIQELDGVKIKTYACGGELNGSTGETAGIGTMCHEFSHCLGYPDFYDTDYSGGQGMGYWDLMCSGSYNDDGYQPVGYTSYERWVAGWKTPIELEYTQNISNMAALQTTGSNSYIIYNKGHNDEYYLLENRQKTGWDASLPGAGLLILHVDYDATAWTSNKPNNDPSHQRMTWIAADNEYQYTTSNNTKYYSFSGMANDPFPYGSVNSFGKNTTPAATLYNKNSDGTYYLNSSVEDITQNSDGTISFSFRGISNVALPNLSPEGGRFAKDQTVTVTITAETGATIYYTTNGDTPTTASTLYSAPFTVTTTTTVKAIAVKDNEESGVATTTYTFVDPYILADDNLSFSAEVGSSDTKQLTVLTEGLTQDITLTLSDANNVFSLGSNTISKSLDEATVDVTFSPSATGNYSGTITLTSAGADPVTVSLTATATLPPVTVPELTVTDVTATTARATWTACDGVTSYTLQLASDNQFTTGGSGSSGETLTETFANVSFSPGGSSYTDQNISGGDLGTWTATSCRGDQGSPVIRYDGTLTSPTIANGVADVAFDYDWPFSESGSCDIELYVGGTSMGTFTVTGGTAGTATYTLDSPVAEPTTIEFLNKATSNKRMRVTQVRITTPSSGGSGSLIGEYSVTGTSHTFTGLTPETIYYARVKGNAGWSNVEEFLTDEAPVTNTAPTWSSTFPATASINVGQYYTLDDVSSYASGSPAPTITLNAPAGLQAELDEDTFTFLAESPGDYSFTFTAANSEGSAEATLTITVSPPPVTVPTLTVGDVTATTAVASWTACDGVTSYTLQLASDEQFTTGGSTTNLSEDFSGFTGTGSNDISSSLNNYTATTGWTGSKVYPENEMAKIGASSGQGWIMTPALNASGTLTIVWSAYRYGTSDNNTILLGVSENGTDFDEETITIGDEMTKYTNTFTVSGPTVYVRWMASGSSKARFYLDDITIKAGGSGSGSLLGEYTVTDGTSYTFTSLTPEDTYYARVKGKSDWSNVRVFFTDEVQALAYGETLLYEGLTGYTSNVDNTSGELVATSNYLDYKSWASISKVYAGGTSNAHSNGGCLKFGSDNAGGSMTTGSISLTNGSTLTFYLKQYDSDSGKLKVTVEGDYDDSEEFTPTSDWTLCTVNLSKVTGNVTITLETTSKRAYVDEIKLTSNGTLELANDDDNTTLIASAANNGGKFNVTLKNRTLYRDGKWNTLCLPFDYDLDAEDSPMDGYGLTVMAFDETSSSFDNGTLTLNFTTVFDNDTYKENLVAGTPYLIKWDEDPTNTTITDPVFYGVTIDATTRNKTCDLGEGTSIAFCGTYEQLSYNADNPSILFLGEDNTLYYPESGASIGAQRAYFHLTGLEAKASAPSDGEGAGNASASPIRAFVLNFGEEASSISEKVIVNTTPSAWYTLDGRKLSGKPTVRGLYINNGKKVVIK